jgi:hypothetical protein
VLAYLSPSPCQITSGKGSGLSVRTAGSAEAPVDSTAVSTAPESLEICMSKGVEIERSCPVGTLQYMYRTVQTRLGLLNDVMQLGKADPQL